MASAEKQTISFAVRGPIAHDDLPGLCERVCKLLTRTPARVAFCDVRDVPADGATADALARLQLAAKRSGCEVRLRGASRELLDLLAFMGLADVMPDSGVQFQGQAEEREELLGVEEERELDDPSVTNLEHL